MEGSRKKTRKAVASQFRNFLFAYRYFSLRAYFFDEPRQRKRAIN
jgi:hypothetical protein